MAALEIVVIINTDDPEPMRLMRESYLRIFQKVAPGSNVQFYNGILDDQLPPVGPGHSYDLLVIGGGTYIPPTDAPWMKRLVEYEKTLFSKFPDKKIVGICLGHQTTATTLGGTMGYLPEAELAVTPIALTRKGKSFFQKSELQIHEFHQRAVETCQPGFAPLAEHNQILLSDSGNYLTFQGHPEMTAEMMECLLLAESSIDSGYMKKDVQEDEESEERAALLKKAKLDHDGMFIWERIIEWVRN